MNDDRLSLSFGGDFAARIRHAAAEAGERPADWVARVVSQSLLGDTQADTGRGAADGPSRSFGPDPASPEGLADPAAWEEVTDQTGTYTVAVPRAWRRDLSLKRGPSGPLADVRVSSLDGATTLFGSDTELGAFAVPGPHAAFLGIPVRPPVPAEQFAAEWLQYRFGARQGFRLLGIRPLPDLAQHFQRTAQASGPGMQWGAAVLALAEYAPDGSRSTVAAATFTGGAQGIWVASVGHVVSVGEAEAYLPALLRVVESTRPTAAQAQRNQAQQAMQNAQHEATMAQIQANTQAMTMRHQQNMGWIQQQGAAHQQRMATMQEGFDAQNQAWQQGQAGLDAMHQATMSSIRTDSPASPMGGGGQQRDFLNAIREERTVVDGDGWEHQVDAGADKYYRRDHDESWIGLQQHQDIRDVEGIDPDDYYETPIIS